MSIFKLENSIQKYDWGTTDFIPNLLSLPNENAEPHAELWLGAHPKSPSLIVRNHHLQKLDRYIMENPVRVLGHMASQIYEQKLPFLFKVLSANSALSIQAHPNKNQAEKGFYTEEKAGIPITAFKRNYRDNNHKPELIVALTPFVAMCGFRSVSEVDYLLDLLDIKDHFPGLSTGLKQVFTDYLNLSDDEVITEELIKKIKVIRNATPHMSIIFKWVLELHKQFGAVSGILAPLFLNTLKLQPGEAIYLEAGILHAYLHGTGLEIMANSDNVLRGGLSSKHIDKAELLKVLSFEHQPPKIINPTQTVGEEVYQTTVKEFELSKLSVTSEDPIEVTAMSAEIILCIDGNCEISDELVLKRGESAFITADTKQYTVKGDALLYRAKTPVKTASF